MKAQVKVFRPNLNQNYIKSLCDEVFLLRSDDIEESDSFFEENGFRYEECWNLDSTLAATILPRLIQFKKATCSTPSRLVKVAEDGHILNGKEAHKEWQKILDKMIVSFYLILTEKYDDFLLTKEVRDKKYKIIKKGLSLFSEYFLDLWD